ncbi:nuclear transcription factor Y subunit beta isoform X1 [Drosophila guanche]|uniref:Uncharacterized protein n=1 Tax=Drosophila guanche TaxID=7266 RepID=A0A3B0J4F6_DROGU|nr:nuclear transcription factor Y subunit beta isoform X1 [Drosophila guanche]SPP76704.1 Hypothetical predicted protein [Drosophila guanche]
MMSRPGQTHNSSSRSSTRWHSSASLLLLMINAICCVTSQYASPYGSSSQTYGYNLPQQQQQQLQQENAYASQQQLNYAQQQYPYVAAQVQSLWTGAPIVVSDNLYSANNNLGQEQQEQQEQQQQQQRYVPINGYYGEDYPGRQSTPFSNWRYNNPERQRKELEVPTRAANHNYNNVPGYVYYQQQEAPVQPRILPGIQPTLQPRFQPGYRPQFGPELDSSEARREEEQVVRIGGSRTVAGNNYNRNYNDNPNYFEPAQPWQRRNFEDKYAEHFSNYLRKYPQRLQPVYNTREDFVDK